MSAADDVAEMQTLAGFIADKLAASTKNKDRTKALYDALNPTAHRDELISWNRCFEFLTGRARTVQSWEKDLARAKRDAIRDADRERKTAEHVAWLQSIYEQAEASGANLDRPEIAVLQRALSAVGALAGAVGNPSQAD